MIGEAFHRIRALFRRMPASAIDEELQSHIERQVEANRAAGMPEDEARRQALIAFGGVEQVREACHQQRPGWLAGTVWQDVRYAVRGFRRSPVFTVTVVVTLALGIGATAAVFSVVDPILFRALPYAHADRLVSLGLVQSLEKQEFTMGGFFFDWREHQAPFEAMASQNAVTHPCDLSENNPERLYCGMVDAHLLPMLGVVPVMGRNFLAEEDRPNAPAVALISYALWTARYNRDASIVNRVIDLDGYKVRVVGVLPKGFVLPSLQPADVLEPLAMDEARERTAMPGRPMRTFALLKPGVTLEQARAAMGPLFARTREWLPAEIRYDFHLGLRSLRDRQMQEVRPAAWTLLGAVAAVLLIACANVAGLFLARGARRQREVAVRAALGASRGRLLRQSLTEALVLSAMGAAAGCGMAWLLLRAFVAIAPAGIPFLDRAALDGRVLSVVTLLALCGAMAFGVAPLLGERMPGLAARDSQSPRQARARRVLVMAQIAVSVVLLTGGALLFRSFRSIEEQKLGMETEGVVTAQVALPSARYPGAREQMQYFLRAEAALAGIPGVTAVGISDSLPPGGWHNEGRISDITVEGRPRTAPGSGGTLVAREVTPGYFRALGIPIVEGRSFSEAERSTQDYPVIVSRLMAARLFPGEDAVGKRLKREQGWSEVVGVAGNVKNDPLGRQDEPELYSLRHSRVEDWGGHAAILVVRTSLPVEATERAMRARMASLDATVPVELEAMGAWVSSLADRPRFETSLVGFFSLTGLVLAVVGLYGVVAFTTAQRTREIGLRMAVGASRGNIVRLVMWEGGRIVLAGAVLGVAGALGLSRLLKSMLVGVGPRDPVSFAAAALGLVAIALAATLVPARSAMQVDPMRALRDE
jgi:putative ABC transport system permease protein